MKCSFPVFALLISIAVTGGAQVASHAPSLPAQPKTGPMATPQAGTTGRPIVRVNGTVMTDIDLLREEFAIFPYARQHGGEIPKDLEPGIRAGAFQMMVFEELVYQEALRRGMTISAAKMADSEAKFRKQFSSPDEFNAFVKSDFQNSMQLLRVKIRRSLLIDALQKLEVEDRARPTAADLRAYYEQKGAKFEHPESYTFQTISILPPANATADQLAEARKRAEAALTQAKAIKSSEQFGLLAEKMSDDDYRVVLGQHKPVAVKDLAPPVLKALEAMKPGDVSDLIQLGQALTIVHYQVHSPAGKDRFETVREQIRKDVLEAKTGRFRAELDKRLRDKAKIESM